MSNSTHTINGIEYPRVTSVIGQRDKPFLKKWHANCAVDYLDEAIRTQDMEPGAAEPQRGIDDSYVIPITSWAFDVNEARIAAVHKSAEAKEVGGLVHNYIHEYLERRMTIMPERDTEYGSAITAFHAWIEKHSPSKVYSEIGVCDPDKRYAGICDFVGLVTVPKIRVKPLMLVTDFKCSPRIYEPDTKMQIAAYMYALERYDDFFRSTKADGGACVRLDKSTGKFWMKLYTRGQLRSAFAMFNKWLEIWHLEHRGKK